MQSKNVLFYYCALETNYSCVLEEYRIEFSQQNVKVMKSLVKKIVI